MFRKITVLQHLWQQNWIFILKTLFPQKTAQCELHKSSIQSRAATAKPLFTESNAQMHKQWCQDHKTWTSDNWKRIIWSDEMTRPSRCSLHRDQFTFGEHPRKPTIRNA
jgi:hypothetical protein